jgi:hypothetical protein
MVNFTSGRSGMFTALVGNGYVALPLLFGVLGAAIWFDRTAIRHLPPEPECQPPRGKGTPDLASFSTLINEDWHTPFTDTIARQQKKNVEDLCQLR